MILIGTRKGLRFLCGWGLSLMPHQYIKDSKVEICRGDRSTIAVEAITVEMIAVETNAVERINTELHYGYS